MAPVSCHTENSAFPDPWAMADLQSIKQTSSATYEIPNCSEWSPCSVLHSLQAQAFDFGAQDRQVYSTGVTRELMTAVQGGPPSLAISNTDLLPVLALTASTYCSCQSGSDLQLCGEGSPSLHYRGYPERGRYQERPQMHEPQSQGICVCPCPPLPGPAEVHPARKEQAWRLPRQILSRHPWPDHQIQTVQHLRMGVV